MSDNSGPLNAAILNFISSKSSGDFAKLTELTKSEIESQPGRIAKVITESPIFQFIETTYQGLDVKLQVDIVVFFTAMRDIPQVYAGFTEKAIIALLETAATTNVQVSTECLKLLREIIKSRTAINDSLLDEVTSSLPKFFDRKVHKDVVIEATTLLAAIISVLPLEKLSWTETPLNYALNHICEQILTEAFKALVNLSLKGCAAVSYLVNKRYHDLAYAQIRFPSVNIKKAIFELFTNIAACCDEHRQLVRLHDMKNRIPVFLCHYDDPTCMQCIEMLDKLKFSVQQLIDEKYIITLILHVAMSPTEFKLRCFKILRNMFQEANEKQIQELIDNGFIRPFCTLLADVDNDDAKTILQILLSVVEEHHGLDSKLCRFDFDHAHSSDNKSCVDQINNMKTRQDKEVVQMAEKLLAHLQAHNIVMHGPNDE